MEILGQAFPQIPLSASIDVAPEIREYERTSTTVATAALRPVVGAYVSKLEEGAGEIGLPKRWQIMQSSGAVTMAETVESEPARILLSGPAGGVEGARAIGEVLGETNLITMDMGGTSCDVAMIQDGRIGWSTGGGVGGHPVALPMVEIHTIGAGGGSIAWVDAGGALRVGPQSAGAVPGPACYGRGGDRPTVTDAHLAIGHFAADRPLGPLPGLDRERAVAAVESVAKPLGMSTERAALGILEVSDAAMERAIRVISVERGHDPRDFALLAFGGAGPLHAVSVARRLSIPRVIIPSTAGVLSAFGLLTAEAGHDESRSLVRPLGSISEGELVERIAELRQAGAAKMRSEGLGESAIRYRASADLRYVGQSHELNIGLLDGPTAGQACLVRLAEDFHREHEVRFGHAAPDEEIELITVRVRVYAPAAPIDFAARSEGNEGEWTADAWFTSEGPARTRCIPRDALRTNETIVGPAILFGSESTILIPDECEGRQDRHGILVVEVG